MRKYHQDGTLPQNGEIFVFGSNLAGIHGAGAALKAIQYGARRGIGVGLCGNTYAIPTKDRNIQTLPLWEIEVSIHDFCKFTKDNPNLKFFVTGVGCGLAGYVADDIAPMFSEAINCSFPDRWAFFLENPNHQ